MPDELKLLDRRAVCALFGDIDASTLYRGIQNGRFPAPIKPGRGTARWLRNECEAALRQIAAERDDPALQAEAAQRIAQANKARARTRALRKAERDALTT
jgi:predicted DNA-binding transcriptional regulator AlpA